MALDFPVSGYLDTNIVAQSRRSVSCGFFGRPLEHPLAIFNH